MRGSSLRRTAVLAAVTAAMAVTAAPAVASHHSAPSPGSAGIGDVLFPTLGNGGYDARPYSLGGRYPTADPGTTVQGRIRMFARATQALSRFDLDFSGDSVESVKVDGHDADW